MQQMRIGAVRRLPVAFGWLTKRGGAATGRWMRPVITQPEIRRDAVRMLRAVFGDTRVLLGRRSICRRSTGPRSSCGRATTE